MYRQAFAGGGQGNLSSPLEFLDGLESVESESLLTKGGKTLASLGKGSGTEVPEGLRKFTLTRIAKFTKFIKQFNPLTKREGKELGYTKFYSRTYTVLTPHPSPLPLRVMENQASLSKGSGTNVPEGFKKRKAAFTLAEVLITLGIIGVVAAMTLPGLMGRYREVVMVNKLKRAYAEIVNAMDMERARLGGSDYEALFETNMSAAEQFDGILRHLQVVERCASNDSKGCGGIYKIKPKKRTNDGSGNVALGSVGGERAVLSDGTLIWFGKRNSNGGCVTTYIKHEVDADGNYVLDSSGNPITTTYDSPHCAEIFFDLDGSNGQNQFGYDCFSFGVKKQFADQHSGYGAMFDTMRTGKLTYERYDISDKF